MKRFAAAVFALFFAVSVFAQENPYNGASAGTQVLLKKANELIRAEGLIPRRLRRNEGY